MDGAPVLLSDDVLAVMRGAVTYAVAYDAAFVAPAHLLLALLDDEKSGTILRETLERGHLVAAARRTVPPGSLQTPEGPLPRGEKAPFVRYDTVMFQSTDGTHHRWLNRDTLRIFNEGARRVSSGRFLPRHLAIGLAMEAQGDAGIHQLLGRDPEFFIETALALKDR